MERMLIRNAQVLTCGGDALERPTDGDILVEGNRIAAVSTGRLDADAGSARVIDAAGATVLPGLGDAHVHISWPLDFVFDHAATAEDPPAKHAFDVTAVARTFLESGYTTVIGAGVMQPLDDVLAKDFIDRGYITGPRIVPSGLMVADAEGIGGDGRFHEVASNARELREIVARQCETGVKALKLFTSGDGAMPEFPSEDVYMTEEMLTAAVEEADKHGAFLTAHARSAPSVAMAARTGVRIIHHACFLDDDALAALEARGDDVWVCPGLHYLWAMVNGHAEPWGFSDEQLAATGYAGELVAQVDGLRKLVAAGVPIVAGGDFGHQWTHHGTYAAELQRYVELVDMTPLEAIHTATRNIGAVAGLDVGVIRPGALADLLMVDGDPTADVTVLQQPDRRRAVIKDGSVAWVNPSLFP